LDQAGGKVPVQGFTVRFGDTPMTLRHPAPSIGEHTDEVLREWVDYSPAAIARLREVNAI
jgi:crotonobetainyl-CoA:carnitine CoA-transferase CaiB-like acyl-CoA transferase